MCLSEWVLVCICACALRVHFCLPFFVNMTDALFVAGTVGRFGLKMIVTAGRSGGHLSQNTGLKGTMAM